MATTVEQLREYLSRMTENSVDQFAVADELLSAIADRIMTEYDNKRISLHSAEDQIIQLNRTLQAKVMELEQRVNREIDEKAGMESLTTDTKGHRDIAWFRQTRKAFATGVGKFCVAVAVTHDEIGMGASHRNTYTETVFRHHVKRALEDKNYRERLRTDENLSLNAVTPTILNSTVSLALYEALGEFAIMTDDHLLPKDGTILSVTGIEFLTPERRSMAETFIQKNVGESPYLHNPTPRGVSRKVGLKFNLGERSGILYGALEHPNIAYRKPIFYDRTIR